METTELLKKVRKIEIKTRRLSNHIFSGEYHSHFKGRGMTFSEVRKYQFGDDIRDITAANSAGMISVAALYGFIEDLQQVKEWGSDYMINKPLDLESLIV